MSSPVAELVGEFDHGLEGGRWSPDGEVLALFTYVDDDDDDEYDHEGDENKLSDDGKSGGSMMTMNARFEVLSRRRGTYHYHGVPTEPLSSYQQLTLPILYAEFVHIPVSIYLLSPYHEQRTEEGET